MNLLKKTLTALLVASMICVPFTACQNQNVEEPSEESSNVQGGEIDLLEEPIVLCDAGGSRYRLLRPAASIPAVGEALTMLMDYPAKHAAPGLKLSWGNDKNEAQPAEILIGYTNRPESLEVLNSIAHDDFAIVLKNGKIVIAAHTAERLSQAADFLCKNLLQIRTGESGKELVFLGSYHYVGSNKYLFDQNNQLSDYAIVYKKGSDRLLAEAETLRDALKEAYGTELPVVDDSTAEQAREILVGNVDRQAAKEVLVSAASGINYSYSIAVREQKIVVGGELDDITPYAVDRFCQTLLTPAYSPVFNLPVDLLETKAALTFQDDSALADGANLRIMSYNILCELFNDKPPIEGREILVTAPLFEYSPDVVGMQEVSEKWHEALKPYLGSTYAVVDAEVGIGHANMCPLFYNTETLILHEHGTKILSFSGAVDEDTRGLRVLSWARFERKSDGAFFIAINTHWDPKEDGEQRRIVQAAETVDLIAVLREMYNCPIVTTGDYNSIITSDPIKNYMESASMRDACDSAQVINRAIKTTHGGLHSSSVSNGNAIDHVFASAEFEILYYNVLCDKYLGNASDHYPVYADLKLTK